ncbi:hypothetical protein NLJ89_g6731 [Agrocybe chaxingu]|uniref:Uncharacterized protein n=1 Tax=Agrocybe chaxingu TaxID=84603 RepID=A0A9W8JY73_9AGAR|nr:hypothetical protein NLJ89_g6731 [Agrocybe chaxingu]
MVLLAHWQTARESEIVLLLASSPPLFLFVRSSFASGWLRRVDSLPPSTQAPVPPLLPFVFHAILTSRSLPPPSLPLSPDWRLCYVVAVLVVVHCRSCPRRGALFLLRWMPTPTLKVMQKLY